MNKVEMIYNEYSGCLECFIYFKFLRYGRFSINKVELIYNEYSGCLKGFIYFRNLEYVYLEERLLLKVESLTVPTSCA